MSRRSGAILALLGARSRLGVAAIYAFITDFPRGLVVFACVLGALAAAWMRAAAARRPRASRGWPSPRS